MLLDLLAQKVAAKAQKLAASQFFVRKNLQPQRKRLQPNEIENL